jgi:hypothetical protein
LPKQARDKVVGQRNVPNADPMTSRECTRSIAWKFPSHDTHKWTRAPARYRLRAMRFTLQRSRPDRRW